MHIACGLLFTEVPTIRLGVYESCVIKLALPVLQCQGNTSFQIQSNVRFDYLTVLIKRLSSLYKIFFHIDLFFCVSIFFSFIEV